MDRILNFLMDIIIAILVMFAAVTIYFGLREETAVKSIINKVVDDFVISVSKNGSITPENYENLYNKLSVTKGIYDISLEHTYTVWEPEYRRKTLQEIIEAQNASYSKSNVYTYREVITQKPEVTDLVNNTNLNTETNESILASAVNIPASVTHVHTAECYAGHRHTDGEGVATSAYQHGCYINVTEGNSVTCGGTYHLINSSSYSCSYSCPHCHDSYSFSGTMNEYQCSNCHSTTNTGTTDAGTWTCKCGVTTRSWYSNIGTITDGCSCNEITYTNIYKCNQEEDTTPVCSQVVMSITPTHPNQTVYVGDNIISTVSATYLNGSIRTIICSISGYDRNKTGTQTVALVYSGLVNNAKTTGTKICMITVNVIPRNKTCTKGHSYYLSPDGSDPGCPYCKAWVDRLELIYPASPSLTITIGTTLQENGVKLRAVYMDGHTQILTNEYVDNLDTKYMGVSIVTIGYKGVTVQLKITTVCAKTTCSICGKTYELYPDKTDPGCPYCLAKIPVFTGNVMKYEETSYTEDILKSIYDSREYQMKQNDSFTLTLANKSTNIARKILHKIFPVISDQWINMKKSTKIRSVSNVP